VTTENSADQHDRGKCRGRAGRSAPSITAMQPARAHHPAHGGDRKNFGVRFHREAEARAATGPIVGEMLGAHADNGRAVFEETAPARERRDSRASTIAGEQTRKRAPTDGDFSAVWQPSASSALFRQGVCAHDDGQAR